jgi:hypothetical protein
MKLPGKRALVTGSSRGIGPAAINPRPHESVVEVERDVFRGVLRVNVEAMHPGWVKTDMGGPKAPLSPEDGADTAVYLATLPDDGHSGGFFYKWRELER